MQLSCLYIIVCLNEYSKCMFMKGHVIILPFREKSSRYFSRQNIWLWLNKAAPTNYRGRRFVSRLSRSPRDQYIASSVAFACAFFPSTARLGYKGHVLRRTSYGAEHFEDPLSCFVSISRPRNSKKPSKSITSRSPVKKYDRHTTRLHQTFSLGIL